MTKRILKKKNYASLFRCLTNEPNSAFYLLFFSYENLLSIYCVCICIICQSQSHKVNSTSEQRHIGNAKL